MSLKRSNAKNTSYTGTTSAVEILTADKDREYIAFYAVSGDCQIVLGDATFADNAITIEEGIMWEPKTVLTANVWFKGDGSKLTILS